MKVIDISLARALRKGHLNPNLMLIGSSNSQFPPLCDFPVIPICSQAALEAASAHADLFIVDYDLNWANPLELTRLISRETPVICLAPLKRSLEWSRAVYAAGATDILYPPFDLEEIHQALSILIRLKRFG